MPVIPSQVASINTATDNCQVTLTKPNGKGKKSKKNLKKCKLSNFQYSTVKHLDKKNQNYRNLSLQIIV